MKNLLFTFLSSLLICSTAQAIDPLMGLTILAASSTANKANRVSKSLGELEDEIKKLDGRVKKLERRDILRSPYRSNFDFGGYNYYESIMSPRRDQ